MTGPGTVTGRIDGTYGRHDGSGPLTITAGGAVRAGRVGIIAAAFNTASVLSVTTGPGAVTGGTNGIYAYLGGSGELNVVTQDVTGTNRFGIYARVNGQRH